METSSSLLRVVRNNRSPITKLISDENRKGLVSSEKTIATPAQTDRATARIYKILLMRLKMILKFTPQNCSRFHKGIIKFGLADIKIL